MSAAGVMCRWLRFWRHVAVACGAGMGYRCARCGRYGRTQLEVLGEDDEVPLVRVQFSRERAESLANRKAA